jgi:hypothetical protein
LNRLNKFDSARPSIQPGKLHPFTVLTGKSLKISHAREQICSHFRRTLSANATRPELTRKNQHKLSLITTSILERFAQNFQLPGNFSQLSQIATIGTDPEMSVS